MTRDEKEKNLKMRRLVSGVYWTWQRRRRSRVRKRASFLTLTLTLIGGDQGEEEGIIFPL